MRAIVVAALVMVAAALSAPAASQAAPSCWQRVLEDWRDGRIDGEYAVHCYREALLHLPEDLRVYGTAETDIQRALARELAERSTQARPTSARSQRRTLAMHTSTRRRAHRTAAARSAKPDSSSFPVRLVVVLGIAALAAAVALASWLGSRRRQEL